MKRIGIFLGFPPEGGGAFQYAHSVLIALAALPAEEFEVVAVHAHPAWSKYVTALSPKVRPVAVRPRAIDGIASIALRTGFPVWFWRKIARHVHPLSATLLDLRCDYWVFPGHEYLVVLS